MPSIGQNLQPFTGNDDVYIVKISLVGRKPPNKQTKENFFIRVLGQTNHILSCNETMDIVLACGITTEGYMCAIKNS